MKLTWRGFCWIAFGIAVLLAAIGVAWYVATPGVASYQVSSLLTLPALVIACVWLHQRLSSRLQWTGAIALALVGPVGYAVIGGAQWWNWGQMTLVPLLLLMLSKVDDSERSWAGGAGDGPWGPP